jgi:hypothetical protein
MGSPRSGFAVDYVAAQFRSAGLGEVRVQEFESSGLRGRNAIGVLRAPGPDFIVVAAHHDSVPEAPGAYDDGGGVGILIETGRVLAQSPERPTTVVFASFDGEEMGGKRGGTTVAGARAFLKSLGADIDHLVGALVVEMSGWKGGTPCLQPIAYEDIRAPGHTVISPAWLVQAAITGSKGKGQELRVGDPWISWLYQPAVRTARIGFHGDDLAFLQLGRPALMLSDSSFTAFYPAYHKATDTPDQLDEAALGRMGRAVIGAVEALARTPARPANEPHWFAAFGFVIGAMPVVLTGIGVGLAVLLRSYRLGGVAFALRIVALGLYAWLFWVYPIPTLWVAGPPLLLGLLRRPLVGTALGLLPALALAGTVAVAWMRGFATGLWLHPYAAAGLLLVVALGLAPFGRTKRQRSSPRGAAAKGSKRGLPRR